MPITYKNIQEMTLHRIDESLAEADATVINVVKNAINQGYMLLAATIDQRTVDKTVTMSNVIPLPVDMVRLINVSHSTIGNLSETDYEQKADLLYLRSKDITGGSITITYVQYPVPLTGDTDTPKLKDALAYALTAYAAYQYQLYRKKYSAAQLLLAEFQSFQGLTPVFNTPIPNE